MVNSYWYDKQHTRIGNHRKCFRADSKTQIIFAVSLNMIKLWILLCFSALIIFIDIIFGNLPVEYIRIYHKWKREKMGFYQK